MRNHPSRRLIALAAALLALVITPVLTGCAGSTADRLAQAEAGLEQGGAKLAQLDELIAQAERIARPDAETQAAINQALAAADTDTRASLLAFLAQAPEYLADLRNQKARAEASLDALRESVAELRALPEPTVWDEIGLLAESVGHVAPFVPAPVGGVLTLVSLIGVGLFGRAKAKSDSALREVAAGVQQVLDDSTDDGREAILAKLKPHQTQQTRQRVKLALAA